MKLQEVKLLLKKYGVRPKHKLGQNFLVSEDIIRRQVEHAELSKRDVVLEIGAGIGTLTEFLIDRAKKIYVIEKDKGMLRILNDRFDGAIEIIPGDVLEIELPDFDKTVSNIPYAISSPLTFKLLKHGFKKAILTYQKEFADRLVAAPGTKDYSRLSVAAYYYADARILETLPPEVFYPSPKVNSAIVELIPKRPPFEVDEKKYFSVVAGLFSHRRKTLRNAALDSFAAIFGREYDKREQRKIVENSLPKEFLEKRVFRLTPEELAEITKRLRISFINTQK
ncbi:MAG: ribosomal RNA small subunit methyltransferase A [Euryarchaeota archaeon]|nr:ribosomal RNA small subunit methyltransferase A [Euryarchaeota archaeon]